MKTVIACMITTLFAVTSVHAQSIFDGETDVTQWPVVGTKKEFGNERFRAKSTTREILKTWSYDQNKKWQYQCDNASLHCAAIFCEYGRPVLLISDPANRGYKIRFWSMDYQKKQRAPLSVESSLFDVDDTTYFGTPTVKVDLSKDAIRKMVFGDTLRIAYSFPLSDNGAAESPNDVYVHMMSFDGPVDPDALFGECAETTNLKTD